VKREEVCCVVWKRGRGIEVLCRKIMSVKNLLHLWMHMCICGVLLRTSNLRCVCCVVCVCVYIYMFVYVCISVHVEHDAHNVHSATIRPNLSNTVYVCVYVYVFVCLCICV